MMNEELNWDNILDDIEQQRAVLLLGHGFLPDAHDELHQLFQLKLKDRLLYFYQRDGLFLFKDKTTKTTEAQQEAVRFYKNAQPETVLLKKIAEMPFRLMVSTNPDKSLVDAFAGFRLPLQFDYFTSGNKDREYPIERPSKDNPLLYNLCGSFEDPESLLLDYDDLFSLMATLLPGDKIPNSEVRTPLQKATTFIFIGFHFERWYTQVLLRYLNMSDRFNNNSRNYALQTSFADAESQQFFLKQFNVKYIGADMAFFEELHQRFSEKHPTQLRKLVDDLSPTATTVVQLIGKDDLAAAFSMLKIFIAQLTDDDQTILTTTEAKYHQYLKDKSDGTVNQENLNILRSTVCLNLLELAKKLN